MNKQRSERENKDTCTQDERQGHTLVYARVPILYQVCVWECEEAEAVVCISDVLTAQMVLWSLLCYCHRFSSEGGCVSVCVCVYIFCGWVCRSYSM